MNPQGTDLLSQLRDIHGAPQLPWWPPAPGWWIIAIIVLALAGYGLYRGIRAWKRRLHRRRTLRWVDEIEQAIDPLNAPQEFVAAFNRIFKVIALRAFPEQPCASMQGEEWVGFLQREMGGEPDVAQLEALATGPYQPRPHFDAEALGRLARRWILQHG